MGCMWPDEPGMATSGTRAATTTGAAMASFRASRGLSSAPAMTDIANWWSGSEAWIGSSRARPGSHPKPTTRASRHSRWRWLSSTGAGVVSAIRSSRPWSVLVQMAAVPFRGGSAPDVRGPSLGACAIGNP